MTNSTGRGPGRRRGRMRALARWLRPVMSIVAVLYFLIDMVCLSALRPIGDAISRLALFDRLANWVRSVHPYVALALFVVPLAVLEPIKPVGLYLMATGHAINGVLLIAGAEIVKILLVERLFHISKDRLMTIPAFAWVYTRAVAWLAYLESLPAWRAVARRAQAIKEKARRIAAEVRRLWRTR